MQVVGEIPNKVESLLLNLVVQNATRFKDSEMGIVKMTKENVHISKHACQSFRLLSL
jgi:hypothetical protein